MFLTIQIFALIKYKKMSVFDIDKSARVDLLKRCTFGAFTNISYITSFKIIGIPKAITIFFTGSLFIGFIAYFILNEKVSKFDILSAVMCICGIAIIENPF
jgi:drug/metabolite transporter (DMT)-like permease